MQEIELTIELMDGNTYPVTLNFGRMMRLEVLKPDASVPFDKLMNGEKEMKYTDVARILYLGYLCGQCRGGQGDAERIENAYTVQEFADLLPDDQEYVVDIAKRMQGGTKKKTGSGKNSSGKPKKKNGKDHTQSQRSSK